MFKGKLKVFKNRNVLSIVLSLLIFSIVYIFSLSNFLYIFDKKIQDLYFVFNDTKISNNLIVVEIDEDTLSWRKDINWNVISEWLWRFPFDRKYYATVIDNLKEAWVSVIALDVIFWEKSEERSDNILSDSIKNAWNVILWLWPNSENIIQFPYEKFWKHLLSSWYFTPNIDRVTNTVYSIRPYSKFKWSEDVYDHFSISVLRWFYSQIYNNNDILTDSYTFSDDKIRINDKIELTRSKKYKNEVLINYNDSHKFFKNSFLDIYNNNFNKDLYKDKIVVIWATAKWIKDIFITPIWTEYGVYTHVNIINTILTKNWIKYFEKNLEWFLIFLLIIVSVYFNISKSSFVLILSNLALVSIFVLGVLYITILTTTLLNYPIELFFALVLSLTISNIVKYLIENKNKTKLNKALSEYVSENIAKEILSWSWNVNLNWENKRIAIFFSDIEWFTTISEKFSPEELVWFLREYLSDMSDVIMDENWFINKYEWDAIMALWWVFWDESKDDSYNVCLSALKQQEILKKLNVWWKARWFSEIKARIWMHIWNAIIWNIWSEWRKMEFTALWDSVNLASRLEWVNKFYWTYICASEDIYSIEKDNFEFRYLDKIKVKWKDNAIKIYELLWIKWEVSEEVLELKNIFEKAVNLYLDRDFKQAKDIFERLIDKWDNAWNMYLDMCNIYIKTPPSNDWDGISTMTSK